MSLAPAARAATRAALLLAVAASLAVGGCSRSAAPSATATATAVTGIGTGTAVAVPGSAPSATVPPVTAPPYYAAVTAAKAPAWDSPQDVTVRDTGTAKVLLTVKPPAPYQTFSFVAGTGVAGRWVVGAQRWHSGLYDGDNNASQFVKLYVLGYSPATRRASLTPLPVPLIQANQLVGNVTSTEEKAGTSVLADVALSLDGRHLATIVTSASGFQVRVYTVANGAVKVWSEPVSASSLPTASPYNDSFSLTWLDDNRTLAISLPRLPTARTSSVAFLDTDTSAGDLMAKVSRTVTLSFPAVTATPTTPVFPKNPAPQACFLPVVTSDGQTIICGGSAVTGDNAAGALNVGFWVFSAATGKLTGKWAPHGICCELESTDFPRVIWASPDGQTVIATGVTAPAAGSQLFIRSASGQLRQIPWPGFIKVPNLENIVEPDVAW